MFIVYPKCLGNITQVFLVQSDFTRSFAADVTQCDRHLSTDSSATVKLFEAFVFHDQWFSMAVSRFLSKLPLISHEIPKFYTIPIVWTPFNMKGIGQLQPISLSNVDHTSKSDT